MDSSEPSEEQIMQVLDFANLDAIQDRSMVIQALKENNGNSELVVSQYFDNPASFRERFTRNWNDSMFSAERDGSDNHTGISFHIESMGPNDVIQGVTPPPEGRGPGAPSRPPSRSNTRSPLGKMVGWAAGDTPGASNNQSQEDQDMQRALRESAQEAGIAVPQQESGVLDSAAAAPAFGPANRSDYDQDSWAMVPSESKVASAPAPETRMRASGAPAFLASGLSSAGEHCLGGLLTILHEIPLARNILLGTGEQAATYGFNSEWWKGQEILPPHVLSQLQSGEMGWDERYEASPPGEEELHRLMAFLDSTERSYGTVSVLTDLIPVSSAGPEKHFFEHLVQSQGEGVLPLTQVATLAHVLGGDEGDEEARFGLLEVEHVRPEYACIKTLYESLDHIMWSDALSSNEILESSKMAMFKKMGDVMTIKMSGDGPEDCVEIPEELYPEKYLSSRKDEARRIQMGWCETKRDMESIAQGEQALHQWRNDLNQQPLDKKKMLLKVVEQWKTCREYLEGRGRFRGMEDSGFNTDKYPDYRAAPCRMDDEGGQHRQAVEDVLQLAERALADMEERLKVINQDLDQIRARQRFLGKLLTAPDKAGRLRPMTCKRFLLCGIATPTDIVYVRQRPEGDDMQVEGASNARDQWWRLAYAPKDAQPVQADKMDTAAVLERVWKETKTPLLVYATDDALDTKRAPLSAPLERFARADNKAFRQELSSASKEAADERQPVAEVTSPSKRKHRADSIDSMDSNRASAGSSTGNCFEEQLEDVGQMEAGKVTARGEAAAACKGEEEPAPPLPARRRVQAGGEEAKSDRGPEMQERARPPAFLAVGQGQTQPDNTDDGQGGGKGIDMELPEYQE